MLVKQLNELNIFALRDLARRKGVVSPTSKKKDELIQGIVDIVTGKEQPQMSKTKQGRPPKTFGFNFDDVFLNENMSSLSVCQEEVTYENDDIKTVVGWVELGNNSAILWVQNENKYEHYFIPNDLLKTLKLKMSDRVVAEVSFDETQKVIKNIFNINGYPVKDLPKERKDYYNIEHKILNRPVKFDVDKYDSLGLKIGENVYFYGLNNNENTNMLIGLMNASDVVNKLYVNISLAEKNKIFVNQLKNAEKFTADITTDVDLARRLVMLAVERVRRIIETGEDVLLVIDDVQSIMGIDKENLNLTKSIVSQTKNGGKNGSITTFAIMPNASIIQVEKLADKRLNIVNNDLILIK